MPDNLNTEITETEVKEQVDISEDISKHINNFNESFSQFYADRRKNIERWKDLYRGKRKGGKAKTFPPEIFTGNEALVSNIIPMILFEDIFFIAEPKDPSLDKLNKLNTYLISSQLNEANFRSKFVKICREAANVSLVAVRVDWNKKVKNMPHYKVRQTIPQADMFGNSVPIEVTTKLENYTKVVYDNIDIKICDWNDVMIDPTIDASDINEITEDRRFTMVELKQMKREWESINGTFDLDKLADNYKDIKYKTADGQEVEKKFKSEYILTDYWGDIPRYWLEPELKDSDEGDELVAGNILKYGNEIVGKRRNPFDYWQKIPYVFCPWIDLSNDAFGLSTTEICEALQLELCNTRDLLLKHKTFALYNMWYKWSQANIENEKLVAKENGIISGDVPADQALKALTPSSMAFQEGNMTENIIKEDLRRAGAPAPIQGIATSKRQTLGEINTLTFQGGSRIKLIAFSICENFLKPMLEMIYAYNQQYITKDRAIKIAGEEGTKWLTISPDDIVGEYNWTPKLILDSENRQNLRSQMMQGLEIITRVSPIMYPNVYGLIRKWYESYGFKDANSVLPMPQNEAMKYEVSPEQEHNLLMNDQPIEPQHWFNHSKHLEAHFLFRKELMRLDRPGLVAMLDDDIKKHIMYMEAMKSQQPMIQQGMPPMPQGMPFRPPMPIPQGGGQ